MVELGEQLWVLDEVQPVAAVLDRGSRDLLGLASWAELPPGPRPAERRVLAGAEGMWVQQPAGPVALIDLEGLRSGHDVGEGVLVATSAHGAWCVRDPRGQDLAATQDAPPRERRDTEELRLVRPGRVTTSVWVDAAVVSVRGLDGDLLLEVEDGTWTRRSLGTPTTWELIMTTRWLRLAADHPVPAKITVGEHAADAPPHGRAPRWPGRVRRPGLGADGMAVAAGLADIDITGRCWPLPAPPVDADDHAAFWRTRLDGLDEIWTDGQGRTHPLADGLSDSRTEVVGSWPQTALHLTFGWTERPGVRLRRVVALYDDLGRAVDPEYAEISLMEDLHTGRVPDHPDPGATYLDV